jgi:hypothetical protein
MNERYGRYAVTLVAGSLLPLLGFVLFNWAVDPLQFYRRASYRPDFSLQQRYQNPGLARNYPYDTVIVGSSLAESLAPSHVDAILGGKSINLSFAGASAHEINRILRVALRTRKVKRVIWCLDIFGFRGKPDRTAQEEGDFPGYLYDRNPFNDLHYLLNLDIFYSSVDILLAEAGLKERDVLDLDRLHNTYAKPEAYSESEVMKKWAKEEEAYAKGYRRFAQDVFTLESLRTSFDQNALSLMREHPEVRFDAYFPPLSVVAYQAAAKEGVLEAANGFKEYVKESLAPLPNVRLFDFQAWEDVTTNLNNYRDILHYSREIDDRILKKIGTEDGKQENGK